jgi:MoxR-like ATPase
VSETSTSFVELGHWLRGRIVGQEALVERLLIALLADGHLLVEGAPGLAKTRAIRELARALEGDFQRIQFTPDLLPGDITGTEIFRPEDGSFRFQRGPVFHNLVLADEINRAPAKVQSALLEAMAERQVSVGGLTHALPPLFLVMATQNPIEQEGTYPLPEAQLDRFLLHVRVGYPARDAEREILRIARGIRKIKPLPDRIQPSWAADARCPVRCPAPDLTESAASSQ